MPLAIRRLEKKINVARAQYRDGLISELEYLSFLANITRDVLDKKVNNRRIELGRIGLTIVPV